MSKKIIYIGGILLILLLVAVAMLMFRSAQTPAGQSSGGVFGFGSGVSNIQTGSGATNVVQTGTISGQKVFKIANGPVASATFIQTSTPTTTVARYIMQDNGHILDLAIDVPGAAARPVSNTTIPGVVSAQWGSNGTSTVLQYVATGVVKSVYMELASTTAAAAVPPTRIQFLPNSIVSLALFSNTNNLTYLLKTPSGTDGYVANADGTNAKKLFSWPLSQITLSWPSQNTILAQAKSAAGYSGIAFSIDVKKGTLSPLLYASGLSATANSIFSKVVYQTTASNNAGAKTYSHDIATGRDTLLANNPLPEKCAWNVTSLADIYCALSLNTQPANYLDLWHQGLVQTADSIVELDTNSGVGTVITLPGDGGVSAPIDQMAASSDGRYLLFITRGDHSLWGVRLTQ